MKIKDIITELSKLPEDLNILSIEVEDWQAQASWHEVSYQDIYSNTDNAIILFYRNYD